MTCDCNFCQELLDKPNNGKLQIWYGTGSNGKTTLLNELVKRNGSAHTFYVSSPAANIEQRGDHRLVCLSEPTETGINRQYLEDYVRKAEHFRKYIVCVNQLPTEELLEEFANYIDVCRFPHRFSNGQMIEI